MGYKLQVFGVEELTSALQRMARAVKPALEDELTNGARITKEVMQAEAPRRTGEFASTIDYDINGLEALIGPDDGQYRGRDVTAAIEYGRLPGSNRPPYMELAQRLGVDPSSAWFIAKAIGERGIAANPFIRRTLALITPLMRDRGIAAALQVTRKFKQ